jgi:cardiolipin synthase
LKSKIGKLLDPLADKLTIVSILLVFIYLDIIPRFISYIILTRELFILLSGIITYIFGLDFINPSFIGKFSIALLYLAIALKLLDINYFGNILFYIVIPINIISAVDYSIRAYKKTFR